MYINQSEQVADIARRQSILITGARGFIGSRLSNYLEERGFTIYRYSGDINDAVALERAWCDATCVIHLAAKCDKKRAGREQDDFITVNVLGTMNVINLCLKHHCRLIYFSSTAAATQGDAYGISKAYAERLVKLCVKTRGLIASIVRPCGIYDENNKSRFGKDVDFTRGRTYPISLLERNVERLVRQPNKPGTCKIFTTKLFFNYYIVYWYSRILKKLRNL